MSYNGTYGAVVDGIIGIIVEEKGRLKNARWKDYKDLIKVSISVSILGVQLNPRAYDLRACLSCPSHLDRGGT